MKIVKMFGICLTLAAAGLPAFAQESSPVNSFFEQGPAKDYALSSIYVGGEVESTGPVELASLPVRELAVKEVALKDGKPEFIGAYFFSGYSLYDILNRKIVKKASEDFKPEVDLYVVVENEKGEKAVFSWGEIYYSRNSFNALISKSARAVNPSKSEVKWPLPDAPGLVCSGDLYNTRFISNPVKITVRSAAGEFPGIKHSKTYTPEFNMIYGGKTVKVADPAKFAVKREYVNAAYGHGMGFKSVENVKGFVLKDILAKAGARPENSGDGLVAVSAKDGYRAVFSLSEIINRGDNADFLLADKGSRDDGRFALYASPDFFVDRSVRSVAKVEVLKI